MNEDPLTNPEATQIGSSSIVAPTPRPVGARKKTQEPTDPIRLPDPDELRRKILKHVLLEAIYEDRDVSRFSVEDIRKALEDAIESINLPAVASLRDELEKIKRDREFSQFEISVGRVSNPVTIKKDFTTARQREEDHPETKKRLGAALWHCLLGLNLGEWDGKWKCSEAYMQPELRRRIEALRSKSNLAVLVDTGSTTEAAVDALLTMDSAAFLVSSPDPRKPGVTHSRLLRLQLTTNSIAIAATVSETNRPLRSNLPVRLIGGDWRVESESICGPLADLCLQSWNFRSDVAVIGTTGTTMRDGQWWLLSEDILESRIKASFLDLSALRVVLLGYEKIDIEPHQFFAAVTSAHVDLIVVDGGRKLSSPPKKLRSFAQAANRRGVSVLLVESPASEFHSRS